MVDHLYRCSVKHGLPCILNLLSVMFTVGGPSVSLGASQLVEFSEASMAAGSSNLLVGSDASMFCEISPQVPTSVPREFHLDCIREVSPNLLQVQSTLLVSSFFCPTLFLP